MAETRDNALLVAAIVASQFGPPFMLAGVAVALPTMGAELDAGATSLGLVETLFLAGSVAFLLPAGRLADASDKNTLYKLGLYSFVVTTALIGAVNSMSAILVLRFLQGATAAVFSATGPAILADVVPSGQRGRAYGMALGAIYSGLALGPVLAGILIDLWGWRSMFFASAAVILAGTLFIRMTLPSRWRKPERSVHRKSAMLVLVAVLLLVTGSATVREGPGGYAFLGAGLVLGVVFVSVQRRLANPLLDITALLGNRVLKNALLVQLLVYVNAFCSIFLLSIFMQVSLGQPARTSGVVLAIGSVLMAAVAPVSGWLADRVRPRLIATVGVAGVFASTLLALGFDRDTSLIVIASMLAIQGLGFAFFSSPNTAIIMGSMPESSSSLASALGAKARSLGMITGMLMTAVLISLQLGNAPVDADPEAFVGTFVTAFRILSVLSGTALVICYLTRTRRHAEAAGA